MVIDWVVSPELHTFPVKEEELSVAEPPEQKLNGPLDVTLTIGSGLTVTVVAVELAEQPLPSVTVTV